MFCYNVNMYINRQAEKILKNSLKSKKISIILGARQVGKTTLVKYVLRNKDSVYFNLDINVDKQRLVSVSSLDPEKAIQVLGNKKYIVIDEAQRLADIGRIVKGWYDAGVKTKIVLLGSSSLDLLNKSSESLTGRNEKIYLMPFMFNEVIKSQSWYSSNLSKKNIEKNFSSQIQELLMQSIVFGGYPETTVVSEKKLYLLNLTSDYLFKDVLQLGLIKTPDLIKQLLALLAHQVGSEVSVNELSKNLSLSRQTIERYIELLEETFVIFRLPAFSTNQRKEIAKSKKIYFWDTGVRNAVLNEFSLNPLRSDMGALWENWVISEFAKQNMLYGQKRNLYFWRSRIGSEVDLIIKEDGKLLAYEIKWRKQKILKKAFTNKYGVEVKLIESSHPIINI